MTDFKLLRRDTGDARSHCCMKCGVITPDSGFCDLCSGVYCDKDLRDGEHYCVDGEAEQ